jgi:hypothetical protein
MGYDSTVVRFSLTGFSPSSATASLDVGVKGFVGGFASGDYGYLVPNEGSGFNDQWHGNLVRFSLTDFTSSGVTIMNLALISDDLRGFSGGFASGDYGYLAPYQNGYSPVEKHGKLVRFSLSNFTTSEVTVLDLASINSGLTGYRSAFVSGNFGYLVVRSAAPPRVVQALRLYSPLLSLSLTMANSLFSAATWCASLSQISPPAASPSSTSPLGTLLSRVSQMASCLATSVTSWSIPGITSSQGEWCASP